MADTTTTVGRAAEINKLHDAFCHGIRTSLGYAIQAGELLIEQRKECGHGNWLSWIKAHLKFAPRTASKYMRCFYKRAELANRPSTADLTIEDVARVTAKPTKEELDERKRQQSELHAKARKLAEDKVKLEELKAFQKDNVIEVEEIAFEDLSEEPFDEEAFQDEIKGYAEARRSLRENERTGKSFQTLAEAYWNALTRGHPADWKKFSAKAVLQLLLKKYPQLMDEGIY